MKRSLAIAAALVLAACQPQDPTGAPARPPADAPVVAAPGPQISDFSQPMTALGTEPFWSVKIEGTRFTLSRPGEPDMVAVAPGAMIQPGQAKWIAKTTEGRQMTVTLFVSPCSDGMSDRAYPMIAEVAVDGAAAMLGCAIKTAALSPPTAGP